MALADRIYKVLTRLRLCKHDWVLGMCECVCMCVCICLCVCVCVCVFVSSLTHEQDTVGA